MNQNVLERLIVKLVADDKSLDSSLQAAVKSAETAAEAIRKAFTDGTRIPEGFESLNKAATQTGKVAKDAFDGMAAAAKDADASFKGFSVESVAGEIDALNKRMRENHEAVRTGAVSREEYRRTLGSQRDELKTLFMQYNQAVRGVKDFGNTQQ